MPKRFVRSHLSGQASGQAMVEYIVMLAMIVAIFMFSMRGVLFPALKRLNEAVVKRIDDGFKSDLHRLPWGSGRR